MSKSKTTKYNTTMTELHNKQMDEFEKKNKKLLNKRKVLKELQSSSNPNLNRIDKVKKEIRELENNEDMTNYLLDIHSVLKQHFEITEKRRVSNIKKKSDRLKRIVTDTETTVKLDENGNYNLNSFVSKNIDNTKRNILNSYMLATTGCSLNNMKENSQYTLDDFLCQECGSDNIVVEKSNSSITCADCSISRDWQDPNLPQYSKETKASRSYRYKPEWYFMEHLNRFQAKESVKFEDGLIESIYDELLKKSIWDKNKITSDLLRSILKKLKKSTYYDNLNTLRKIITGEKAPYFGQTIERKLCTMFAMIKEPYEKWKNIIKNRNNFLYYPYVTRNLVILLSKNGHPEIAKYKNYFRPLKNEEKMLEQEKVWEKICEECDWPFYESMSEWPWNNDN